MVTGMGEDVVINSTVPTTKGLDVFVRSKGGTELDLYVNELRV